MHRMVLICVLLLAGCKSALIQKEKLAGLNQKLQEEVLVTKTDILPDFAGPGNEVVFKSGSKIRIWVEASDDWLRVKAIGAQQSREQARGQTILYVFRKDLELEARRADNKEKLKMEDRALAYLRHHISRMTGYAL